MPEFLADWKFWSVILSLIAIVLSQLPPVRLWFRPTRISVDVHSRLVISHFVGNPNVALVVGLTNSGGRKIRVKRMQMMIEREGMQPLTLPGLNYFETASSTSSVLLVPFELSPDESWSHSVLFVKAFNRAREQAMRGHLSALRADINAKVQARPEGNKELVTVDPRLVAPFSEIFIELFMWTPGEYKMTLSIETGPKAASFSKKYRFTLYETDTADLRKHTEDYKYGGAINWNTDAHAPLQIPHVED